MNFHKIEPLLSDLNLVAGLYLEPEFTFEVALTLADEKIAAGLGARAGATNRFGFVSPGC